MSPIFIPSRRDVVLGSAAATALFMAPTGRAWSETTFVRPDINSAAGQKMLDLYAKAVAAMQNPTINYPPQPHSWTFQAYMHAVPSNPFDPAVSGGLWGGKALKPRIDDIYGHPAAGTPQAAWKKAAQECWATCQHSSPYFTTWHRWYLYYFERICRKMCGDPEFALPYWNYASDIGPSLQLPAQFQQLSQNPNPLYFDDRGLGFATPQATGDQNVSMNAGGYLPYPLVRYGPALSSKDMFPSDPSDNVNTDPTNPVYLAYGFTGRLECAPHDNVHSYVGGWMQNVPSAAGDPIFFMHHCQIDRLYASWEAAPGVSYNWGSSATQPDQKTWTTRMATYVDENGALVEAILGKAVDIAALGYAYDTLAKPPAEEVAALSPALAAARPAARVTLAALEARGLVVKSGGTVVTLSPAARPEGTAPQAALPATGAAGPPQTLVLSGIKLLRRPPAPLSVFINLPEGTPPRLSSPYYVGTLNLFNFDLGTRAPMNHDAGDMGADHTPGMSAGGTARFDVTGILARQRAEGLWDGGAVTVTISTIGADVKGGATYLTIESAALIP